MSRQPWIQAFRLILTVTLVPLWVGCDGRTVEPPEPTTITVSPSSVTLHSIDDSVQLSAVIHDQNGQVMPEVPVWWASSEPSVAAINTTGMVTAARNGEATVTASVGTVSAAAGITVAQEVAEVEVSPSADTLVALEDTVLVVGKARDANGHLIEDVTFNWSSTDASVASVDISGLVTAARNGRAAVIARAGAVSASVEILVEQEVAGVSVSPSTDALVAFGDTVRLTAEARDANEHGIEGTTFSWRSGDPRAAMVNTSGLVTAVGNGSATVTASAGAESGIAQVTVAQEVAGIRVSPSAHTLVALDDTVRLAAAAEDANGHLIEGAVLSWASSDTSTATVGALGLVTAVGNGVATVTASDGSKSATAQVTVVQEVAEVMVSPSAHTLVAFGDTVRLAAEVRDANGHLIEGAMLSWASSNTLTATVDALGLVAAVGNGVATVTASAGAESATAEITVAQEVADVSVSPSIDSLVAFGDTLRLAAEARDANQHVVEEAVFNWVSSHSQVAMVDITGLVTAVGNGRATVTVSDGALLAVAEILVEQEVADVRVSLSAHTLVAFEDTVRLVAEARDANGHLIEGATFNWSSTDASVASVDISGLVTAARNGRATVIARAGAVSANVEIFVEQEVADVRVSPSADTLVAFGDTVRLVAEAQDANGHLIDGVAFSWASNEPSVAPVDISGLVTAVGNGRANVIAQAGAASAIVAILVKQEVVEVSVSPSADTLVAFEDTVRLVAEARDANGHVVEGATFSWASSDPRVAMVDTSGLVSVVGNGRAWVTTSAGAVSATAEITVAQEVADVRMTPSAHTLVAFGDTVRLAVEARDPNGHLIEGAAFSWASSDASVAPVDSSGLVTAVGNGKATVTASVEAVSATAVITVAQEVADVSVSPSAHTLLALGDTVRLAAEAQDANGHVVAEAEFVWSADGDSVATVDPTGLVMAAANGTSTITAMAGEVSGSAVVTVAQVVSAVTVSPAADSLLVADTVRLSAAAADANGCAVNGAEFAWASDDTLVALVDDSGLVTAVSEGVVEIRATSSGVSGTAVVTIRATAVGVPAKMAVVAGTGQEVLVGTAVPIPPAVLITDSAGTPLPDIPVTFLAGGGATITGAEATTDTLGRAAVGSWTLGTTADVYRLSASLDADGVEGNPSFIEARAVPGPASEIVIVEGDNQESEVELPVPVSPKIQVRDSYGNGVAGLSVSFRGGGGSVANPSESVTDTGGFAAVDQWILGAREGMSYRLTAHVSDGDQPVGMIRFTATTTPSVYDIVIVHADSSALSEGQLEAFAKAEEFWEKAIQGNLGWNTIKKPDLERCLSRADIDYEVPGDRVVDDLLIYADVREIDGQGGILAGAGPCMIRQEGLPAVGVMFFDIEDINELEEQEGRQLDGTILHEMAHVMGFGSLWEHLGLLRDPVDPSQPTGNEDPHFVGDSAIKAFNEIGGDEYTGGEPVPVENRGGVGSVNGHWREFVFRTELMSPYLNEGVPNPLSVVTLASFQDLGYEQVDLTLADEFELPTSSPGLAADLAHQLRMGGDVLRIPLAVVDR